ncbi:MAG: hypothetical protein HY360_09645 [Verrucomicrobia bacterium]|nr:hypothetical protein [Verrucomicrobiota bacterium]
MKTIQLSSVISLGLLMSLRAEDDNLVLNDDFEGGIEPWRGQKLVRSGEQEKVVSAPELIAWTT